MQIESLKDILYSFMMENGASLLLVVDGEGVITRANHSATALLGRELTGSSFSSILINFQNELQFSEISQNSKEPLLLNVINSEGLPLTYYFHFRNLGEETLAIGQQDAAEVDQMRRNLLSLNNELNNLTRQLHKKNAQLALLDKKKNQFFGMASHDLRHPLGIINMYSGFLNTEARECLTPEHAEFLSYIQSSGRLMEEILNDFLDFAIFESGRLELHPVQLELVAFLKNITRYSQPLAKSKGIDLQFYSELAEQTLMLDPAKMEQVINNLIHNSIKFSPEGSTIVVKLKKLGNDVCIEVFDEGVGLEEKSIPSLFNPFMRLKSENSITEKSSGLGLAIVKKIVNSHGGSVHAGNRKQRGSVFTVSLPLTGNTDQ